MKKIFLFSVISCLLFGAANAADTINWWEHGGQICRLNSDRCYPSMGTGYLFDVTRQDSWDEDSGCWGKKLVCVEALKNSTATEPVPMKMTELVSTSLISSDFDIMTLNSGDNCFGVRKTANGGATASVNGQYVKVWCSGILDNPDEILENGEITFGTQPNCTYLSERDHVDVQNGKCYGKRYARPTYRIMCSDETTPILVVLNGADPDGASNQSIQSRDQADALFNTMYTNAQAQHRIYFKD